jgi:lipid-A-disaccharide synthase
VIMYKMNMVTAGLARKLVKGKFFGMPNLVMDEKIIPELFQEEAEPPFLAAEILKYIRNKEYLESTKLKLANVKKRLGSQGATVRVVDEIQKFLKL